MTAPITGPFTEGLAREKWRRKLQAHGYRVLSEPVALRVEPREPGSREACTKTEAAA